MLFEEIKKNANKYSNNTIIKKKVNKYSKYSNNTIIKKKS